MKKGTQGGHAREKETCDGGIKIDPRPKKEHLGEIERQRQTGRRTLEVLPQKDTMRNPNKDHRTTPAKTPTRENKDAEGKGTPREKDTGGKRDAGGEDTAGKKTPEEKDTGAE